MLTYKPVRDSYTSFEVFWDSRQQMRQIDKITQILCPQMSARNWDYRTIIESNNCSAIQMHANKNDQGNNKWTQMSPLSFLL